jgi:hypothetical protein
MLDDFSALDLLSIGGFRLSSSPLEPSIGKRRLTRRRLETGTSAKRRLASLLPMLGRKFGRKADPQYNLQGWPVALSWPTKTVAPVDPWAESASHTAS